MKQPCFLFTSQRHSSDRKALIELAPAAAGEIWGAGLALELQGWELGIGNWGLGMLPVASTYWGCCLWPALIGDAVCGQHSAPALRTRAGHSPPWLGHRHCAGVSGSGKCFSPVIPNAVPAELGSFPPAFYCLL